MIGPIFAHWAIVYIGQLFENYRVGTKFGATLFHGKSYVLIFTKNMLPRLLFWQFLQTHLVTLTGSFVEKHKKRKNQFNVELCK
jgi:hypothetical protein